MTSSVHVLVYGCDRRKMALQSRLGEIGSRCRHGARWTRAFSRRLPGRISAELAGKVHSCSCFDQFWVGWRWFEVSVFVAMASWGAPLEPR
jgi:hypothetical protein